MKSNSQFSWLSIIKIGLLGSVVALLISLVGLVQASDRRAIIPGVLTMGQTLLLLSMVFSAYLAVREVRKAKEGEITRTLLIASGALSSLVVSAMLAALVIIGSIVNLRVVLLNASPELFEILTVGLGRGVGLVVLLVIGASVGALISYVLTLQEKYQQAIILGLSLIPVIAILNSALFAGRGVSLLSAIIIFLVSSVLSYWWSTSKDRLKERYNNLAPG
ncbi:MAG: hypothetical protein JXA42_24315, partial [Anaerolineales bacterium]|nr:hypothetical protein [Anaerolineales bacterium]